MGPGKGSDPNPAPINQPTYPTYEPLSPHLRNISGYRHLSPPSENLGGEAPLLNPWESLSGVAAQADTGKAPHTAPTITTTKNSGDQSNANQTGPHSSGESHPQGSSATSAEAQGNQSSFGGHSSANGQPQPPPNGWQGNFYPNSYTPSYGPHMDLPTWVTPQVQIIQLHRTKVTPLTMGRTKVTPSHQGSNQGHPPHQGSFYYQQPGPSSFFQGPFPSTQAPGGGAATRNVGALQLSRSNPFRSRSTPESGPCC